MAQQAQCPFCGMVMDVPPGLAGARGKCAGCGKILEFAPTQPEAPVEPLPSVPTEAAGKGGGVWKIVALVLGIGCGGLVLISIISILVGLFLPALFKAQESARRSACHSNCMQIQLALIQYANEYDGNYPCALADDSEAAQRRFARLLQLGYLNAAKVFKCPSASYDVRPDHDRLNAETLTDSSLESIADVYLSDGWCSYGIDPTVNHAHPYHRAVLADKPDLRYWGTGVSSPGAGEEGSNSQNHGGDGQNISYNDGHVKWSPTCRDGANIDPNVYATNPEIKRADDSNIDFGE